ncbi:MAG: hypothetical protein GX038_06255, partial [Erysipelothrix sp.]|nr:hypothetical protein [Erysipelothrix sp.]
MSGKINAIVEFELSQNALESLVLLYQPVFSFNALSLYLTLYEIGRTKKVISEKELVHLLKTSTDDIVIQRQELEQMNLVKTYRNQGFTIVLNQPLKA